MKELKPLVKWGGGKGDELKFIIQHIPPQINTYLEPFVGGGAVFFHLNHTNNIINDIHPELTTFYKTIKNGKGKDIYNFMTENPNDEETYYWVRDEFDPKTDLEVAQKFYYLRKTCYRGMLRYNKQGKFNVPFGRYKTCNYESLVDEDYENLFKNTEVYNCDFEYIFKNFNDESNFMFLDPPYDCEFTDYGYCSFGKTEHKRLSKLFKKTKIKCLMVIGKTDFITSLYSDYIVDEYDKKYKFKIHSNRVGDEINKTHLIIKNF